MKKFFLIPLMTLVCSVMAWGATVNFPGDGTYTTLADAVNAAGDDGKVVLTDHITLSSGNGVPLQTYSTTIDLNGYTITSTTNYGIAIAAAGKTLTIEDSSADHTGKIEHTGANYALYGSNGVLRVKGGTITTTGKYSIYVSASTTLYFDDGTVSGPVGIQTLGTTTIANGTINGTTTDGIVSTGTLNITGGTIVGENSGVQNVNNMTVSGGSIEGGTNGIHLLNRVNNQNAFVSAGSLNMTGGVVTGATGIYANSTGTVTISGGTISSSSSTAINIKYAGCTLNMNGGTATGTWALQNYGTATITNGTLDGSLWGIMAYGGSTTTVDGENVKIKGGLSGIQVGGILAGTTDVTVDFRAGAITSPVKCFQVNGPTDSSKQAVLTISGGTFTVTPTDPNSTSTTGMDVQGNIVSADSDRDAYNAIVNISGGTFSGGYSGVALWGKGAVANISGGNISANAFAVCGNGTPKYNGTEINITGGTIGTATTDMGIYHPQAGTLTISGGTINGLTGIGIKSGSLTMTGGTINAVGEKAVYETGYNGGALRTGAAISIESNGNYAGNMAIAISDAAKLQSAQGYALYEYVANYNAPTKVNSLSVANGLFQGGISVSQSLAAKGGFVSGGKWSVDVTANVAADSAANPIEEDPYFFKVGTPTEATAQKNNAIGQNAVLVNAAASSDEISAAQSEAEKQTAVTSTATNSVVVTENTDVVVAGDNDIVEAKKVTVEGDAQLSVKEGATLMVGAGSVLLDTTATTGGLTVEAGAALVVDGLVYGSTEDNFVIKGQEDKSGIVLFSPETEFIKEDHPTATYRFTSKSFRDGSKWVYQRFGMPSFDGTVTVKSGNLAVNSYICTWDYATDDWGAWSPKIPEGGLVYAGEDKAVPFQCYQLGSTNAKDAPVTYDFVVELMGNANAPLNFKAGWNPYANSYTAPIDIKEFLTDVIANNGSDILATIYLYKDLGNDTYTWQGINLSNVGKTYRVRENGAMVKKTYDASIEPMQAFIMKLSNGEDATTDINYLNNVYNPAMGIDRPASAPARSRASYNEMQIGAYNDMYWDNISVMEGEQFSAAEDNGYDAPKYDHNKGLSLYVINGEQHMERVATDNADGMFIGINAPVAGTYTLDFSGIVGMNYSLIDMTNNTVVKIEEDGQYNFYAEAGQNDYRFQLVAPAKVPTAIENTAAKTNMKGVYTITGQYLGADINALPKGVYIINGAKVVK